MTTTGTTTCDYAACKEPATTRAGSWAFCGKHAEDDRKLRQEEAAPVAAPSPLARLLEDASGHSNTRIRKLAARVEKDLDQLRALVTEHEKAERERKVAEQERAAARAEVERLEAQLRAAREKASQSGRYTRTPDHVAASAAAMTGTTRRTWEARRTGVCVDCGTPITRAPGQKGVLPIRCPEHRRKTA